MRFFFWNQNMLMNPPRRQYTRGLSAADKRMHSKHMKERKEAYKSGNPIKKAPILKSYKHRKSKWVQKFANAYGISLLDKRAIYKIFGVRPQEQATILKKGKGAFFSDGSRPAQTPFSWARGRLASVLLGGPACEIDLPGRCERLRQLKKKARSQKEK
tara:strand:- start:527 stop:1000 length:474 start_codon:yes stop_codon:yes gene_type:complete